MIQRTFPCNIIIYYIRWTTNTSKLEIIPGIVICTFSLSRTLYPIVSPLSPFLSVPLSSVPLAVTLFSFRFSFIHLQLLLSLSLSLCSSLYFQFRFSSIRFPLSFLSRRSPRIPVFWERKSRQVATVQFSNDFTTLAVPHWSSLRCPAPILSRDRLLFSFFIENSLIVTTFPFNVLLSWTCDFCQIEPLLPFEYRQAASAWMTASSAPTSLVIPVFESRVWVPNCDSEAGLHFHQALKLFWS